jgi:hypothetical protein
MTMFETKMNFSALSKPRAFKDRLVKFTRSLRGETEKPGAYEGDAGDDGGQGTNGIIQRTRSLRSVFGRPWRGRPRALTNVTLVNSPESSSPCGPPDGTGVEMDEMNKKAATSEV